jgi:transcriptional regulator with XRE-family HTH domain
LDDMAGRLLLRLAAVLHRAVASEQANGHWISRRDRALRAANRRGVPVAELAARLGLSEGWVRQVLNGRKPAEPPVIEEAT